MEIRRALTSDICEICQIEKEIFRDPWSEESVRATISTEGAMCYVALRDGKIAAYILGRVIVPEGELYRIATREEYRRRGIGYRLLDYCVKCEAQGGLESLFLEVREHNEPAIKLYSSYGFVPVGLRKNYYKDPTENALIMMYERIGNANITETV
jgi:ribosomal-protein-alanine N-acetyltransferase